MLLAAVNHPLHCHVFGPATGLTAIYCHNLDIMWGKSVTALSVPFMGKGNLK